MNGIQDEGSDYINAVPVDGYDAQDQFIVTQMPLPNTFEDFWQMVHENDVNIVVCLNLVPINDDVSYLNHFLLSTDNYVFLT